MASDIVLEDLISNIDIKAIHNKGDLLASVIITIADAITINCFLRRGPHGMFLNLPSTKDTKTGQWYSNVKFHHGTEKIILNLVTAAYNRKLKGFKPVIGREAPENLDPFS